MSARHASVRNLYGAGSHWVSPGRALRQETLRMGYSLHVERAHCQHSKNFAIACPKLAGRTELGTHIFLSMHSICADAVSREPRRRQDFVCGG